MHQKELRALMARMEEQVALSTGSAPTDENKKDLTRAWEGLVSQLALGPAPETRACPSCSRDIMRAASMCGFCWTKLVPEAHA